MAKRRWSCSTTSRCSITRDPLDPWNFLEPQLLNRYHYTGNNPLRFVDDTGEEMRDAVQKIYVPMSSVPGQQSGYFTAESKPMQRDVNTGDIIVNTHMKIWIASDQSAEVQNEAELHEGQHYQQYLEARSEEGYDDLDKQLQATYDRTTAEGQRKGWSEAKTATVREARLLRQLTNAVFEIKRAYERKKRAFEREEKRRRKAAEPTKWPDGHKPKMPCQRTS